MYLIHYRSINIQQKQGTNKSSMPLILHLLKWIYMPPTTTNNNNIDNVGDEIENENGGNNDKK